MNLEKIEQTKKAVLIKEDILKFMRIFEFNFTGVQRIIIFIFFAFSFFEIKAQSRDTTLDFRIKNDSITLYSEFENSLNSFEDTLTIYDYFFCDIEILIYSKRTIVIDTELKYKNVYASIPLSLYFYPVDKTTNKLILKEIDFKQINIIDSINLKIIKELSIKDTSIFFSNSIKEYIITQIYKELNKWEYNLIHGYSSDCEIVIALRVFLK